MNLCKCGCGLEVKENYKRGHGRKGKENSIEHNRKIGEANSDHSHVAWNKGLKGRFHFTDEMKARHSEMAKKKGFGKWMKGRKLSKSVAEKLRAGCRKFHDNLTEGERDLINKKISIANSGESNGMFGKTHTDEVRRVISESAKNMWNNPVIRDQILSSPERIINCRKGALMAAETMRDYDFCNTKPEKYMKSCLDMFNIDYVQHYSVWNIEHCYSADFYIPSLNTIIEVDGRYWHYYPYGREIDHIRIKELSDAGYGILRFWEDRFNENDVINALGGCV